MLKQKLIKSILLSCSFTGYSLVAMANDQAESRGIIEDQKFNLLNRTVFDKRDYRHGGKNSAARNSRKPKAERNDYAEEWGYGLMATYTSGFTQGTVGLGFDAQSYLGIKLDTGGGRAGKARLLALKNDGHPKDYYNRTGGAAKLRVSSTILKYGVMRTKTPIFSSSDSRLLPETATGWLLVSNEFKPLTVQAGHFTAGADRNATKNTNNLVVNYANPSFKQGKTFDFVGGTYSGIKDLSITAYTGRYENNWRTHYLGAYYTYAFDKKNSLNFDFNFYRSEDTGKSYAGDISNTTWSLLATFNHDYHKFSMGYQKVNSDTPFDYVTRGAIWLGNAVQLSDFNAPHEKSWQARYDLDMAIMGIQGLSLSASYVKGTGIDGSKIEKNSAYNWLGYGRGGKHWERDLTAKYTIPSGFAKDLTILIRHDVHRGNKAQAELDTNQIRIAMEYPLSW